MTAAVQRRMLALLAALPIVGGTPAEPGAWPDVVAVIAPLAICSGTLVAPDVVLTAGHCIAARPALVVVDTVDFGRPGGEVIAVAHAYAYPDWTKQYDVGVLVLAEPAHVAPRAIAEGCARDDGDALAAVGFGLTVVNGANTTLRAATIAVDDAACADCRVPGGELVAGGGGATACYGDSGGPAFASTPSGPALAGITSRAVARPCEDGVVFERADAIAPWVEQVTGRSLTRAPCDELAPDDGCHTGGGGGGGALLALCSTTAATWRRSRSRLRSSRWTATR